jgi:DNA-binding GntR family transcriptional regulator
MHLIRARIISGEYPVDSLIPSTTDLVEESRMSRPVVRRAIDQLKAEGILRGHQGKGVYVSEVPAVADRRRADTEALGEEFAELRREFRKLAEDISSEDLRARFGRLESRMGRVEAAISTVAKRSRQPDPFGGVGDDTQKAARRGRAG